MRTQLRCLLTALLLAGPLAAPGRCGFEFGFAPGTTRADDSPAGPHLKRADSSDGAAVHFVRPVSGSQDVARFFDRQFWMNADVIDSPEPVAAQAARAGSILSPVHGTILEDELRLLIPDDQPSRRVASGTNSLAPDSTTTSAPVEVPEPAAWLLAATGASLLAAIVIRLRRHP